MNILIDTNILLWVLFDDARLSKKQIAHIHNTDNAIIISGISIFEISLKYSLNKIDLNGVKPDQIPGLLINNGYEIEDYDYGLFSTFYKLPDNIHKDPFDRLLIWLAINKNYYLMSNDGKFKEYDKHGLKLI